MSSFDRDNGKQLDSPGGATRQTPAASSSNSDADDSAAHIAELVRRTGERHARSGPSAPPPADVTAPQPPMPDRPGPQPETERFAPPVGQPETRRLELPVGQPETQRFALPPEQPEASRFAQPETPPTRPATRQWSPALLVAAGAIAVALIVGGFALSRTGSSNTTPTSPVAAAVAPAVYTVQVTDVIKDCANHSHGRTRNSFQNENCLKATRFLATGQVSGRPAVYVVSKIQMASAQAAVSVKQVLDATGTGNLNDLLREGKTFTGAPNTMPDSGYASVQTGTVVVVAEAGFIRGPSSNTNPALRAAASRVAALVTAQG
jgi:hypothetical protein